MSAPTGRPDRFAPDGPRWLIQSREGRSRVYLWVDQHGTACPDGKTGTNPQPALTGACMYATEEGWVHPEGIGPWETDEQWRESRVRWCPIIVARYDFAREHGTPMLHGSSDVVGYLPDGSDRVMYEVAS